MGHWQPTRRPRAKCWQGVTDALGGGEGAPLVVAAVMKAAGQRLLEAGCDPAVQAALALLLRVPAAATAADLAKGLRELGLAVGPAPALSEITCAFSERLDRQLERQGIRSDLGELAQMAAVETLVAVLRGTAGAPKSPVEIRETLRLGAGADGIAHLAEEFFGRFTARWISFQISRETSHHVGPGARFKDLRETREFEAATGLRSKIAGHLVARVVHDWLATVGKLDVAPMDGIDALISRSMAAIHDELLRAAS